MANEQNLKPFTGADDPRRMNGKPKGTKHLSTYIQEALVDPTFELKLKDGTILKEMPIKAIIKTAVAKSVSGDTRAMEWLAKHGYGEKLNLEVTDTRRDILSRYGLISEGDNEQDTDGK
jgi:hypothetical protein